MLGGGGDLRTQHQFIVGFPSEISELVFSFVAPQVALTCANVSRHFKEICLSNTLWRHHFRRDFYEPLDELGQPPAVLPESLACFTGFQATTSRDWLHIYAEATRFARQVDDMRTFWAPKGPSWLLDCPACLHFPDGQTRPLGVKLPLIITSRDRGGQWVHVKHPRIKLPPGELFVTSHTHRTTPLTAVAGGPLIRPSASGPYYPCVMPHGASYRYARTWPPPGTYSWSVGWSSVPWRAQLEGHPLHKDALAENRPVHFPATVHGWQSEALDENAFRGFVEFRVGPAPGSAAPDGPNGHPWHVYVEGLAQLGETGEVWERLRAALSVVMEGCPHDVQARYTELCAAEGITRPPPLAAELDQLPGTLWLRGLLHEEPRQAALAAAWRRYLQDPDQAQPQPQDPVAGLQAASKGLAVESPGAPEPERPLVKPPLPYPGCGAARVVGLLDVLLGRSGLGAAPDQPPDEQWSPTSPAQRALRQALGEVQLGGPVTVRPSVATYVTRRDQFGCFYWQQPTRRLFQCPCCGAFVLRLTLGAAPTALWDPCPVCDWAVPEALWTAFVDRRMAQWGALMRLEAAPQEPAAAGAEGGAVEAVEEAEMPPVDRIDPDLAARHAPELAEARSRFARSMGGPGRPMPLAELFLPGPVDPETARQLLRWCCMQAQGPMPSGTDPADAAGAVDPRGWEGWAKAALAGGQYPQDSQDSQDSQDPQDPGAWDDGGDA
ncbi:hypothetical protein PAPYR_5693 [Paratrimastix pyriformis]|uniref:F-box domain-containing protein n=1 Tax=Paratrimastix pyriformis TaxID=342808 RepID=A0ABQ8UGX5_9EUKA|nr:hypothetical protein PAPYR_5693 [Paratrimastix pyriformis]